MEEDKYLFSVLKPICYAFNGLKLGGAIGGEAGLLFINDRPK
jgi:hypothetical protein